MGNIDIFSVRLLEARKRKNLTQDRLAELVGISGQSVSKYERGESRPELVTAVAIAETLNVSLDWLFDLKKGNTEAALVDYARTLVDLASYSADVYVRRDEMLADNFDIIKTSELVIRLDGILGEFLYNWTKIKKLTDDDTVPAELYELWLDNEYKKLQEYSDKAEVNENGKEQ